MINNKTTLSPREPNITPKQIKRIPQSYRNSINKQQSLKGLHNIGRNDNNNNLSQAERLSNAEYHVKNFLNTVLAEVDSDAELHSDINRKRKSQFKLKEDKNDTIQSSLHLTKSSADISSCENRDIIDNLSFSSKRKILQKKKSEVSYHHQENTAKTKVSFSPYSEGNEKQIQYDQAAVIKKSYQKYKSMGQHSKFFKTKLNDSGIELDNDNLNNKTVIEASSSQQKYNLHHKHRTSYNYINKHQLSSANICKFDFENEHVLNDNNKSNSHFAKNQPHHVIEIQNMKGLTNSNKIVLKRICEELKENICNSQNNLDIHSDILKVETKTYQNENDNMINSQPTTLCGKEFKYRHLIRKAYVYDSLDDEEFDDEIDVMFCIKPSSPFIIVFDFVIVIIVFSSLIYTPISLAFNYSFSIPYNLWEIIYEFIFDIIMLIDVFLRFLRAYYINDDVLMVQMNKIANHYFCTWFFPDLITSLPINSFIMRKHNNDVYQNKLFFYEFYMSKKVLQLLRFIRMFKIINVFHINSFVIFAKNHLTHYHYFNKFSRLFISILVFFITVHILSSVFIFIGRLNYPNWISEKHNDISSSSLYLDSFYFIISSIYAVGYGDIVTVSISEKIFNLFLLIFGVMIYSWGLSSISSYVQTKDAQKLDYTKKCAILDEIKRTHHKMSFDLYEKVGRYLYYRMKAEKNDKATIIDTLPIGLRNNLIWEMYKPIIENFTFFNSFNHTDFIVRIILAFKPIVGLKHDILVKEGEFMEEMIFVKKGNLTLQLPLPNLALVRPKITTYQKLMNLNFRQRESLINLEQIRSSFDQFSQNFNQLNLTTEDDQIEQKQYVKIMELRRNEHFGDVLMFLNKRSPLTLKVKSKVVEMFYLKKMEAIDISSSYPDIWDKINQKSIFNMEQIERLIKKAQKLFYKANEKQLTMLIRENRRQASLYPRLVSRNNKMIAELFHIVINDNTSYDLMSIPSKNSIPAQSRSYQAENSQIKDKSSNDVDEDNGNQSKDSSCLYEKSNMDNNSKSNPKIINEIIEEQDSEQTIELKLEDEKQLISSNKSNTTTSLSNKQSQTQLTHISFDNHNHKKNNSHVTTKYNIGTQSLYEINSSTSFTIKSLYDNIHTYNKFDIEKTIQLVKMIIRFDREELLSRLKRKSIEIIKRKKSNEPISNKQLIIRSNSFDTKKSSHHIRKCMTKTLYDSNSNKDELEPSVFNQREISKKKFDHLRANFFNRAKTNVSEEVSRGKVKRVMSPRGGGNKLQQKNTLFKINENIKMNSINLNNPELFYSEYFQKVMNKEHDIKEKQAIIKRLKNMKKIVMDDVPSESMCSSSLNEIEGKQQQQQLSKNYTCQGDDSNNLNSNKKLKDK